MSSSLVLLDSEGVVVRRLQLVSLPDDYVIPEGMTVSWRMGINLSSLDPVAGLRGPREPLEAYFYFRNAWGEVYRDGFKSFENVDHQTRYGSRNLIVTVQGTSAKDVMELRDYILQLINSGARWGTSNDLNPKPKQKKFLRRTK